MTSNGDRKQNSSIHIGWFRPVNSSLQAILVFILYCCKIHRLFQAVEHENSPMAWNIGGLPGLFFIKPVEGVPAHAHAHTCIR